MRRAALGWHAVTLRFLMSSEMHREREGAMTLGARQGDAMVMAPPGLGRGFTKPQHAPNRLDSIRRDSFSGDARQARLFAFLSGKLCREFDGHIVVLILVEATNARMMSGQ